MTILGHTGWMDGWMARTERPKEDAREKGRYWNLLYIGWLWKGPRQKNWDVEEGKEDEER